MVCLNGYFDRGHQYEQKFYGCKHILLEEYDIIRDELQPRELLEDRKTICVSIMVAVGFGMDGPVFSNLGRSHSMVDNDKSER